MVFNSTGAERSAQPLCGWPDCDLVEPSSGNPPQGKTPLAGDAFDLGETTIATPVLEPQQLHRPIRLEHGEHRVKPDDPV